MIKCFMPSFSSCCTEYLRQYGSRNNQNPGKPNSAVAIRRDLGLGESRAGSARGTHRYDHEESACRVGGVRRDSCLTWTGSPKSRPRETLCLQKSLDLQCAGPSGTLNILSVLCSIVLQSTRQKSACGPQTTALKSPLEGHPRCLFPHQSSSV